MPDLLRETFQLPEGPVDIEYPAARLSAESLAHLRAHIALALERARSRVARDCAARGEPYQPQLPLTLRLDIPAGGQ